MNRTVSKLLSEEELDQVHVVLFKYNFTSNAYLQKCGKPLLCIRDRFQKELITIELSHKQCIIRALHRCLIYRINPSCTFERIIFVLERNAIKLQLHCQSNITIIQQAELEYNDITILEVFDEDVCKNGVYFTETLNSGNEAIIWEEERKTVAINAFFAEESNANFIRAMKKVKKEEDKNKGFRLDLRYYLKWAYLCLAAVTIIISITTISTLLVEFYFQRQHYLAKSKPVKLIVNKELRNEVRSVKHALHHHTVPRR